MPSPGLFTPWEKELVVEIEGHKTMRSFPMQGDTLFDHIMEVYLWRTPHTVASNLDYVVDQIEIAHFNPEKKYLKVKIRSPKRSQKIKAFCK